MYDYTTLNCGKQYLCTSMQPCIFTALAINGICSVNFTLRITSLRASN